MQPNIIERVWRQDKMVNVDVLNGFVFTGEAGAHQFVISGKNVNTPVDISGTVTANFKNADNVLVPLDGTIEDGKAVVVLSPECYAVEGPFSLMIFADTVCIYAAIANAINSSGETIAYPTASIPSVQELIEDLHEILDNWPADYTELQGDVQDLKSALTTIENPFFFNNISADRGVDVTIDANGYINISGTASSSGKVTTSAVLPLAVGKWYLNITKISGTAKPTMYVTDPGGTNVATYLAASGSTILSFDVSEAGNYGVFFWVNSGDTYSYTYSVMMTKDAPETFVKGGAISSLYDTVDAIERVTVKDSGNILKPAVLGAWNGLQIDYLENYQAFSITGTKGNVWSRAVIGTITPETSGSYTLSYVDRKGNGKPAIYIYNGSTSVLTWGAAYLTGTATLTAGVTYTVEAYIAPNETADYLISLKCESGTKATLFKPYGMVRKFDLSDKTFSICGVSIDTYYGWIPEGNSTYYSSSNLASVNMTWWKKLMDDTGIQLVVNNSWNGSCASTVNSRTSCGATRCLALNDGTTNPDIIIVGMFGANDWASSAAGEYTFGTSLPGVDDDLTDDTTYNTYKAVTDTYAGGLATMFYRMHEKYPHARIYALDMYNYYRGAGLDPAGTSTSHNIPLVNKTLYDVAATFGVTVIHTSECGINAVNSGDYCVDSSGGTPLHPNDAGHTLIYQMVRNRLRYDYAQ